MTTSDEGPPAIVTLAVVTALYVVTDNVAVIVIQRVRQHAVTFREHLDMRHYVAGLRTYRNRHETRMRPRPP